MSLVLSAAARSLGGGCELLTIDTNFFILMNFSLDKRGVRAREILKHIIQGDPAVTSSLALDEIMWIMLHNNQASKMRAVISEVYRIRNLEIKRVSQLAPLRALDFVENYNLKPRDALHASIMEELGIHKIVNDDPDFDNIPGIKRIKL